MKENYFTHVIPTVESIILGKSSDESEHQTPLQDKIKRFLKFQNNQSLLFAMSNTSATANQDEKLMNKCCKVHRLPQKLSDLLLESSFDDDCKKNTTTNAIKKLKLTDFKFQ